jgi:hypothetical protein
VAPASDTALLDRFIREHDEDAFAALVARHVPMVQGACRRVLHDIHHAEDAFQATFLLLARKAGTVRPPDRLAAWLHGVARQVALPLRCWSTPAPRPRGGCWPSWPAACRRPGKRVRPRRRCVGWSTGAPDEGPEAAALEPAVDVGRLERLRDEWLETPNFEDLYDRAPASVIARERARLPEGVTGAEAAADPDCPLCQMMADDAGPYFWHLDGCNMDDDFAFSFHATREEWEAERREWEDFNRRFEEEQRAGKPAGTPPRFGRGATPTRTRATTHRCYGFSAWALAWRN